jgi:hypothetical protein
MTPTGGHTWEAPGGGDFVFNNNGLDRDFRVESDGNAHMLFVDASTNRIGIGNSDPGSQLDVGDTTYHDGTLTVNGSIALNSSSNLNPSLNRWAMRVRAAGNEGHLDFYDGRNAAARVTFDDGGKVGIGKSPASYDGMLTIENPNATRSYVDRVRTEWNSIFNVSEATHHQRFKLTVDNTRRSSLVKITCQPRSSGGISSMNGCTMELSIYRADGGAGFSLTSINNGGHGGGSIRFAKPVASGNDVIFSIITSNNGTGTTYQVATKVEVIGNTDNNIIYSEIAGSASGGGSDPGTGHFFYANGVELAGLEYNETTFNEDSNNKDFRVESSGNANMLFVDGGNNRVGIGHNTPNTLLSVQGAYAGQISNFFDTGTNGNAMYNGAAVLGVSRTSNGSTSLHGPIFEVGRDNGLNATYNVSDSFLTVRSDSTVINEDSQDHDFRVESDTQEKAIFVDASNDEVRILGNKFLEPVSAYFISTGTLNRNITVGLNGCGEYYIIMHIVGIWPYSGSTPGTRIIEVAGFGSSNVINVIRNTHYGSGPTGAVTVSASGGNLVVSIATGQNYRWAAHCEVVHGGGGMHMSVDGSNG